MLDVLKNHGSITLLTLERFEPKRIDEYYGTNLVGADIRPVIVSDPVVDLCQRFGVPHGLIKLHALMKAAKRFQREQPDFDLLCSGYDEQDLGRPCLQYLHYPWNLYPRPDAPPGWNDRWFLRSVILAYNLLCRKFSDFSYQRVYQNLTLVNSGWTGEKARERYSELSYLVMNPPALAQKIDDDGSRRARRFLSIGRCAQEKEWLKLIDIVTGLRERGHEVGLTLAGSRNTKSYEDQVRARIEEAGGWAQLKLDFSREELQELLMTHRYGLHGMKEEHYGMAVAELVLGGCLASVPDDGGQVEIVRNPQLRYRSVSDAVEKWDRVLSSETLQKDLLAEQRAIRGHLTKERFLGEYDRIVSLCLERGVEGVLHGFKDGSLSELGRFSV
jgi:glycosyltransferase involved in cell wall biosynthesis